MAVVPAGDGFSASARYRIDQAIEYAQRRTGITFSVSVGPISGDPRAHVRSLLGDQAPHVVLFVSPDQRQLEIATNAQAHLLVTNEVCALTALSMSTSFSVGDLIGGIVTGLRMLAEGARPALTV